MSRISQLQHCPSWVSDDDDNNYLNGWGSPLLCSTPKKYQEKPQEPPKVEKPKPTEKVPLVVPKDDNNTRYIKVDDDVVVSVVKFKDTPYVDVRKCFMGKYGGMLFTKKGIRINQDQWKALKRVTGKIDKCFKEMKSQNAQ